MDSWIHWHVSTVACTLSSSLSTFVFYVRKMINWTIKIHWKLALFLPRWGFRTRRFSINFSRRNSSHVGSQNFLKSTLVPSDSLASKVKIFSLERVFFFLFLFFRVIEHSGLWKLVQERSSNLMSKKRASIQRVHQITKVPNNEIFTINHHGHNVNKWKVTRTRKSGHQFSLEMFFVFLSNLCQFMSVSFGNSGSSQRVCDRYLSLARLQSNRLCSRICLRFPKWKSLKILFVVKKSIGCEDSLSCFSFSRIYIFPFRFTIY